MMKQTNLILFFLASILMVGCTFSTGGDKPCVPDMPKRVGEVPDSAKWIGGCDGGQWYYIHEDYIAEKFHISVYHDYNGELYKEADYVWKEPNEYPESFKELYNQILDFDGEEIHTSNGVLVEEQKELYVEAIKDTQLLRLTYQFSKRLRKTNELIEIYFRNDSLMYISPDIAIMNGAFLGYEKNDSINRVVAFYMEPEYSSISKYMDTSILIKQIPPDYTLWDSINPDLLYCPSFWTFRIDKKGRLIKQDKYLVE